MNGRIVRLATLVGLTGLAACDKSSEVLEPAEDSSLASSPSLAAVVGVAVRDNFFSPTPVTVGQGGTVQWNFQGESAHTATDRTGMRLFDSGIKVQGQQYPFTFNAAGRYPYRCELHDGMTGKVAVPIKVAPASGGPNTTFTITWSATAAPNGYVFDVQVKRPGSSFFVDWRTGQTVRRRTFTPDAGSGNYLFRSHLRKLSNGAKSEYSQPKSISVS